MGKNIVLCSDGTGNKDIKDRGTNVFKLYEAVDIQGYKNGTAPKQVAFYDDGVGTSGFVKKILGEAFGRGFSGNVKKLYRELVNVYEPGDSIYLFGFSRGAYTVRALAGFIQYWGVLDVQHYQHLPRRALTKKINACWKEFRTIAFRRTRPKHRGMMLSSDEVESIRETTKERRRNNHAVRPEETVHIAFIGVWDTVGAIGSPFGWARKLISLIHPIWFADNILGPEVGRACQALSIDDERLTFHPELWNEQNGRDTRLLQVWFSGVHSNVGGGYPKQGMSLVALDWMMTHAHNEGLHLIGSDTLFVHGHQDVHDKLYDSRSGAAVLYRWAPRNIASLCAEHNIARAKIHISVFERIANGTDAYAPGNIPFECEVDAGGSLLAWPVPAAPADIAALMAAVGPPAVHAASLLEKMKATVQCGIWSYRALIVLLIAFLAALVGLKLHGCWSWAVGAAVSFPVLSILIYRWAVSVDEALKGEYTGFWHNHRDALRTIIR